MAVLSIVLRLLLLVCIASLLFYSVTCLMDASTRSHEKYKEENVENDMEDDYELSDLERSFQV